MNRRLLLLAIGLAGMAALLLRQPTRSAADTNPAPASPASGFIGAGSCSASACHNANFAKGNTGSEYTLWVTRDPHAKAYEMLFSARSTQMQKNLRSATPAHEEARCLKCHVAPNYDVKQPPPDAPHFKTDGVSCESCHGPAKHWVALHHLDGWQTKTPAQKKSLGMNDTQSTLGRAQVCVTCHVGAPGMDVDHDLIAAGHPRLQFEFSSFHTQMPRHWPDWKDRDATKSSRGRADFEGRAWYIGQIVNAHAALDLLGDRAADKSKPWPEFANHDCAACHHDLRAFSSTKSAAKRMPGALDWNVFPAVLPAQLNAIDGFASMNRQRIAQSAKVNVLTLRRELENIDTRAPSAAAWQELLAELPKARSPRSRDQALLSSLAGLALYNTHRDLGLKLPADLLDSFRSFARQSPRPSPYDPEAIRRRLVELQTLGNEKGP